MSGPVAVVDTSIFIGAKNPDEVEHRACLRVLDLVHERRIHAFVSAVTLAEVLTGFRLEDDSAGAAEFLSYVTASDRLNFVAVGLSICDIAATVRASMALRLPDAIIVATAIDRSATTIITHDKEFARARSLVPPITARAVIDLVRSEK
jgi:predicted nucleic acid-binding protein